MGVLKTLLNCGKKINGDGGFGSKLIAHGLTFRDVPELWNKNHPDVVENIHREFIHAGARYIETNTFGGNTITLTRHGITGCTYELNHLGAQLARKAVDGAEILVAGSLGPTGTLLEPFGKTSSRQMQESYTEQVRALVDGGVDFIIVETMTSLDEAIIALNEAKVTGLDVVVSMTFDKKKTGFFTLMGESINICIEKLNAGGACAIGSNCGWGTNLMIEIAAQFREQTDAPLFFSPNAGLPEVINGKISYKEGIEEFENFTRKMIELDVSLIGGCCGTDASHISAIARILSKVDLE